MNYYIDYKIDRMFDFKVFCFLFRLWVMFKQSNKDC